MIKRHNRYLTGVSKRFARPAVRTFINPALCIRLVMAMLSLLFIQSKATAQFTTTWVLTSDNTNVTTGTDAVNITAGLMDPFNAVGTAAYNANGYGIQTTRANWATTPSDDFRLDFPIEPAPGYDINLESLSFRSRTSGGSGNSAVAISYQVDGAGPWIPISTNPALPHLFNGSSTNFNGTLAETFTSGHTYVLRMYLYWASSGSSANTNRTVTIGTVVLGGTTVVSGSAPDVITSGSAAVTRTTATANGFITPVISPVTESGIAWGLFPEPDITGDHLATSPLVDAGAFNINITGLQAGQTYYYRAYATNGVGTSYGVDSTFTTDPPVIATLTTTIASSITAISALSGGDISDDGGAAISQRGLVWNTTGTPFYPADASSSNGTGTGAYSSSAQILLPATAYFARAYAINSAGTAYGNEITFTTSVATPTLVVVPDSLAFGTVLQNTTSPSLTYTLSGYFLSPAAGNITITAPAGYQVSTNATSGFANSITVPYTGSTLANTTIYVHFTPNSLANYNKIIINSGGGAPAQNVKVTGAIDPVGGQGQQGFSNKGKDFWVGYGASEKMTGDNSQDLRFTFNNPNPVDATVTISIPNQAGFTPLVYTVPANSIITTNAGEIPEGATAGVDARLLSEGVFNAGIHIVSDQPIVAYAHNVTSSVYAASVLFPTPTLGREYTSLNFTQRFNSSSSANRSYCFAIATEDNTLIEVVLPPGVATETHADGTTFTQLLNKGEVLNLFGASSGSETAIDLSGVVVRSVSGTTGCKPFAFFCGSGKISIDCSTNSNVSVSGDNLFQQMFPKVAWGYKYITVPTQPASMNINHFRILVDNPSAVVKRNGVTLSGLVNNAYYEYLNTDASIDVIESDKPIMVAQYMTSHGQCGNPAASVGDPEMIYLSSIQQTIDTVSLVSSPLGNTSNRAHFINVTTKTADAGSFLLDGAPVSFTPVAYDPSFSYAQVPVAETFHTLTSPRGFNAIAYGVANDESYGYNAGTNLVDLLSGFNVQNQYAAGVSVTACRGSQFFMRVTLAFRATSILWDFGANPNLAPSASITETNPVPEDSVVINGVLLYIYKLSTPFVYNALGSFDVKVVANNPTPDGCDGNKTFTFPITVGQGPVADFSFSGTSGCLAPIQFTDASNGNGGTINSWQWNFGDAALDSIQNPSHTYASGGSFSVKLRAITAEGCYADTTKLLTFSGIPVAGFRFNASGCENIAQTFTDTSKIANGTITNWNWNFGDGSATAVVNATSGNAQTHTYTTAGVYTITLSVVSNTGCVSNVFSQQVTIGATPVATFAPIAAVCGSTTAFALTTGSPATVAGVGTGVYSGTGVVNGNFDPAVAGTGIHTITYTYTTVGGCAATATQTVSVSNPVAGFRFNANGCVNVAQTFTDTSTISGGTITNWNWNFGDGSATAEVNATNGNPQTHIYTTPGVYTVSLTVVSSTGCTSSVPGQQVTIADPSVTFAPINGVCNSAAAFALTTASPATVAGVGTGVYSGAGVVNGNFDPSVAGVGTQTITYTYTTVGGCVASATQTIAVSQSATLTIAPVTTLCTTSSAVTLVPSLAGGVFSGTGVTGNTFSPTAAGAGTFTIAYSIPSNACTLPASLEIVVNNGPTDFSAGPDVTGIFGRHNIITGTGSSDNTYLWSPADSLIDPRALATTSTVIGTTTYTLTATNRAGCKATDAMVLTINKICVDPPTVFTPNGDGFYDKWVVINGTCVTRVQVTVYNRWGGIVYSSERYANDWDGAYKGTPLPDGTYYYVMKAFLTNGEYADFKGNVTIMR